MDRHELAMLDDDGLDALIAELDPLRDVAPADPSAPAAQEMLASILADRVQPLPLWRRRGPIVLAGLAVAGTAATALSLLAPDVPEPFALVCHASLGGETTSVSLPTDDVFTTEDAAARCRSVLASGTVGDVGVAAAEGRLSVCREDEGRLGVYPADSCEEVRRATATADPDAQAAPADFAAVRALLSELQASSACLSPSVIDRELPRIVAGTVVEDWTVERVGPVDDGEACASLTVDPPARTIVVVARPPVEASDGEAVDLEAVEAADEALFAALWVPEEECVTADAAEARLRAALAGTAYAAWPIEVEPPVTAVDACVELRAAEDGRIVLTPFEP